MKELCYYGQKLDATLAYNFDYNLAIERFCCEVLERMGDKNLFRSFGDALIQYFNATQVDNIVTIQNAAMYIMACCYKNGVDVDSIGSRWTLEDWFKNGVSPRRNSKGNIAMQNLVSAVAKSSIEEVYIKYKIYLDSGVENENTYQCLTALRDRAKSLSCKEVDIITKKSQISNNLLYLRITGLQPHVTNKTKTVLGKSKLPPVIKRNYPEPWMMGLKKLSSEAIRKMVILLESYCYWVEELIETNNEDADIMQNENKKKKLSKYIHQINAKLSECGLAPIYVGNPHDWLYMLCAYTDEPLEIYRNFLKAATVE